MFGTHPQLIIICMTIYNIRCQKMRFELYECVKGVEISLISMFDTDIITDTSGKEVISELYIIFVIEVWFG